MKNRNIIFGIDGTPFKLIENLSNKGIMPNFKELKKEYSFTKMQSSIPPVSSVSWSSIITGKNPGEHGIYGFSDLIKNTYSIRYPNFNALRCDPFWQKQPIKKHVIFNVPSTYPAKALNGIHIAGFVALDLEKAVYPKEVYETLKTFNYEIDVDSKLAHQQSKDVFLKELFRIVNIRQKVYLYLWDKLKWDNFMFIITSSDRLGHFLWNVYEDKNSNYHEKFLEFFRLIDDIIGDLYSRLGENDKFIILSDHGMELIKQNIYLNTFLEREGYLELSENFKNYNRITNKTKAFVLDPGRVYLNKKEHYPNGSVSKEQENDLIKELKDLFLDFKFDNQRIIKKVYKKEEIYNGNMLDYAPDLILLEHTGFRLRGTIGEKNLFKSDIFSGKHNEDAFLFVNKDIEIKNPNVEEVISLIDGE